MFVPQVMAQCYEFCSNNCTFGFFAKTEKFFGWPTNVKLGKYMINFGVKVVSNVLLFWAFCEEVLLCFDLSQTAVGADSLIPSHKYTQK